MADRESQLAAGRRLARDLHSIRRKRGVDLKEVLDVTRLAEDVIDQLEETALIDHPAFNRVYLRSLYTSYAPVLGISLTDMVTALDEALSGHYVGSLASIYLGEKPATEDLPEIEKGDELEDEGESTSDGPEEESSAETRPTVSAEEETSDSDTQASKDIPSTQHTSPGLLPRFKLVTTKFSKLGDGLRSSRESVLLPNMSGTLILAVVGIALIALIWFALSWVLSLSEDGDATLAAADTTSVPVVIMPDPIVLPDTFAVEIIASAEALDPVRVTVDRDLRKPYWVEHQDTLVFYVTDRIRIEREVENTRILVDGFPAPPEWFIEAQPVDITRLTTQAWLDSLTDSGITPQRLSVRR